MTTAGIEHHSGGAVATDGPLEATRTLTGEFDLHREVRSAHLDRARDVLVWLPPGYATHPYHRFPVLYMQDGQNLFDRSTSFAGTEWMVDEVLQSLVLQGSVQPLIVVGVYNTPDRVVEYTHVRDPQYGGGAGERYERFLVEELKPFIDGAYRTRPEPAETGLAGSSLGGLVSLRVGLRRPDVFGKLGVVSPSVWWAENEILARVAEAPHCGSRIWLDIGTAEGRDADGARQAVDGARALRDALLARGWRLGADLAYFEDPGAHHDEAAWAGRVARVAQFLYPSDSSRSLANTL